MDTLQLLNYLEELKGKYTLQEESRQQEILASITSINDVKKNKDEEEEELSKFKQYLREYNDYEKKKNNFILKLILNLVLNIIFIKIVATFNISSLYQLIINLAVLISSNGFIFGKFEKYYQKCPIKKIKKDYPTKRTIDEEIYRKEELLRKLDLQISGLESSLAIIEHLDTNVKALQMINDIGKSLRGQDELEVAEIDHDNAYLWLTNVSRKLRKGEKKENDG